jgi:hypothetical protein
MIHSFIEDDGIIRYSFHNVKVTDVPINMVRHIGGSSLFGIPAMSQRLNEHNGQLTVETIKDANAPVPEVPVETPGGRRRSSIIASMGWSHEMIGVDQNTPGRIEFRASGNFTPAQSMLTQTEIDHAFPTVRPMSDTDIFEEL